MNRETEHKINKIPAVDRSRLYDVVVIGGGPAGLTAALYLARARYRVLVVEKDHFGGQITITSEVVNYPGVSRCSGTELTESMRRQAQSFGAEFLLAEVEGLRMEGDIKEVKTSRGSFQCFGVLLATGAHSRMVGFQGEEEHKGRGVAYCATCDGEFFTGKDIFVVGGGFAAAEESIFLTKFARRVTILIRGDDFTCAEAVASQARNHEKITVLTNTSVEEVAGENGLDYIRYKNSRTGQVTEFRAAPGETFGVFVFAGYEPATGLVKDIARLNEQGYVETDRSQKTSRDGLYAAGDVCVKPLRQVVTAVGDGALAATELERYAARMQERTGLVPDKPQSGAVGNADGSRIPMTGGAAAGGNRMSVAGGTAADSSQMSASGGTAGSISAGSSETASKERIDSGGIFDEETLAGLRTVFEKMETPLTLKLYLDETPVSWELKQYMETMAALTDKLVVEEATNAASARAFQEAPELQEDQEYENSPVLWSARPCVRIFRQDGSYSGLAFHGVPGGHEFTSFVLGLYNAAGHGQAIAEDLQKRAEALRGPLDMKVLVSLSCTMCPELVMAAQKTASLNESVTAEVYDLKHFPDLKERYKVMSVPCLVINDSQVTFGKKNIAQLLEVLERKS